MLSGHLELGLYQGPEQLGPKVGQHVHHKLFLFQYSNSAFILRPPPISDVFFIITGWS